MRTIRERDTAMSFWARYLTAEGIVAAGAVRYSPRRWPGTSTQNETFSEHEMVDLPELLREGRLPTYAFPHRPGVPLLARTGDIAIAIGNPFFKWSGERLDRSAVSGWSWLRYQNYERERSFVELICNGSITPYAMLLIDIDCLPSKLNTNRIAGVLTNHYRRTPWSLFHSKHSYHLFIKELFPPGQYTRKMGELICAFADTQPSYRSHIVRKFGLDLKSAGNDTHRLLKWCDDSLGTFCHYDMPADGKFPSIIDMKNAQASVRQYVQYIEGHTTVFGAIRLNPKHKNDSPPYIVANNHPIWGKRYINAG